MDNNKKLISVIIPIYNVEIYLKKCINSIINQTYSNLEIILVDDGSTDESGDICDYYANIDNRISVIHKTNSGQSDARNVGIDMCNGDYIYFIDSDDYANLNALERLLKLAETMDADLVIADINIVNEDYIILETTASKMGYIEIFTPEEGVDRFIELDWGPWNKLYSNNIFKNIRFPSKKIHEDEAIMLHIFFYTTKIVYTHEKLYNYLKRSDSTTGVSYSKKKIDWFEAWKENVDFSKTNFPNSYKKALSKLVVTAVYNLDNLILMNDKNANILKKSILETLNKYQKEIYFNKHISINYKIRVMLASLNIGFYKKIFGGRINESCKS